MQHLIHTMCPNMAELDICTPQARLARPLSTSVWRQHNSIMIRAIFAACEDGGRQFEHWIKGTCPEKEWSRGLHKKTPVLAGDSGTGETEGSAACCRVRAGVAGYVAAANDLISFLQQ